MVDLVLDVHRAVKTGQVGYCANHTIDQSTSSDSWHLRILHEWQTLRFGMLFGPPRL